METSLDDKTVIDAFISHLTSSGYPELKIDRRPDEDNRNSADIDAIAGKFAIEHTSIDTVPNQRRDSERFMKAIGGIENELSNQLPFRLNITLPYEGVQHGQDWSNIRDSFTDWIVNCSPKLPDGSHAISDHSGIPFEFYTRKKSGRQPGVFFSRFAPQDSTLSNRVNSQLIRKSKKLVPYKNKGYTTILLVESSDIALMDDLIMLDAIRKGFSHKLPAGIDQIWYADTSIPEELLFRDFTILIKK